MLLNKYIRSELWLLYDSDWYKLLKSLGYLRGKHCCDGRKAVMAEKHIRSDLAQQTPVMAHDHLI